MWEQIRSNRIRSMVVLSFMGMLLVATGMALAAMFGARNGGFLVGGAAGFGVWFIMWLVTLSRGDDIMLRMAGARKIEKKDHPRLWNVVEEMTIASGLPVMPRVFIVDDPSPNAFATGRKPERAAVSVTTGLLRMMNRDELQGVVAHEIGHIKNRDVALITTAGVMVGAIVLLAEIGIRALWFGGGMRRSRSSSSREGGGQAQAILMIVAILLLILAPIFAQLIYFALSRRREYLADASGALFTRYPEGLARALEKLAGNRVPLADQSRVTAPMYIVRPLRPGEVMKATSAFATHPPLEKRIRILRAMGGGADYRSYEEAYRKVAGGSVIGARTLSAAEGVGIREAAAEGPAGEHARHREASDALLSASGYARIECGSCGAVLKIPPSVASRVDRCPRCRARL